MPLSKYHIRNEYSLADPELYRSADKDDPEAILEAIAMAGLVGLLRQLGDLAEFAVQIFHDLHEEVTATAARGHSLMARVKQLEAEVPSLEKAFYSQTHHSSFYTNGGIGWHPNLQSEQNLVTHGHLPRFIMDSYEECRGPPRLFLLDKFDVAGAGACLKRYTDPSSLKMESASSGIAAEVHREKRIRKVKKKGARLRDGEAPNTVPSHSKLHQLLLEDRVENGYCDPARLVKLKKRQLNGSSVEATAGKSYMEKFLETSSPDHKMICETSIILPPVKLMLDDTSEAGVKILEISTINPVKKPLGNDNESPSPSGEELGLKPFSEVDGETNVDLVKVKEQISAGVANEMSSNYPKLPGERELVVDEQKKIEGSLDGYHSEDVTSEVDNYMDALTTMESELETDSEWKPKNGFLNTHKAADTDGKEEHGLQARFSDSQSIGDSSMSDEISSFKQDRNEELIKVQVHFSDSHSTGSSSTSDSNSSFIRDGNEHVELQAHFSDTQSVGNSSTSDENSSFKKDKSYLTHSDSLSTLVESKQSEPILLRYSKCYEPEIKDTPSQLTQIFGLQNTDCGKLVMDDDANIHKEEISDYGQASSDLMIAGHVLGSATPVTFPAGTQSDETPSDPVELNLRLENNEDRKGLVEPIAAKPASLSQLKDDSCPVDSSDGKSSNNLDDNDSCFHPDNFLQISNDLESARENECGDHSEIKMLQAESPIENSSDMFISRNISQGEDRSCPSMEELDSNSDDILALDNRDSKDEDCIVGTQLNLEDLSSVPTVSCFTGEVSSDLSHDSPHDEPGSAEIGVPCSDLPSDFEKIPKMVHGDEIGGSICSVDLVESASCFKHPYSPDNLVMINDVVTENAHSEDHAALTIPSVETAENDVGISSSPASGLISSPSRSLSNLQEPVSGSSGSHKMEMESSEVESAQISTVLNKVQGENQMQPPVDITSSDIICSPMSNLTKLEESLSTYADPHEKEMEVSEVIASESSTELEEQKIGEQPEIASADVQLSLNKSVLCDLSDSEICNDIQNSPSREQFQHSAFVNDMKMLPEFSGLDTQQSESIFNGQDSYSSSSCNQLEPETDLELLLKSQVGEPDTEFLPRDEENFASEKSQSQQMQIYQPEQERSHSTSKFASEMHADEPSSSFSLPQSSGLEINPTKRVMDPLKPLLPDLFPEPTENNLDEMPPMPPLPPMQWRMGKVQHASLFSQGRETEVNRASVQPMQPIKPGKISQSGLPTFERDTLPCQSPILPVMAVERDKLQQSSGFSVGVSGHPVVMPFQFPIMVNDAKGQYNYVVLDGNQIQNPFFTLPVVSTSRPPHGYIVASEGEMVQNSNLCSPILPAECAVSGHDSIPPQEKLIQPPSQLIPEAGSEVKTLQKSTSNLVSTGRPPHSYNEGEMVQSSNPCLPIPAAECATYGHDSVSPQEKLTQSPSQLMTETNFSVVKTLHQSSSNVLSMGRPPHGCDDVASEGEMVQNSNPLPPVAPAECSVSGHEPISPQEKPNQPPSQLMTDASSEVKTLRQSISNVEEERGHPPISLMSPPDTESMEPNQGILRSEGEMVLSVGTSAQPSDLESERTNEKPKNKLPRPRNPLIDAVVAHDKSKLRRVAERVMPQIAPKLEERDSLLEQIRTKSFNLKPAVSTRPSIRGPKTNLKVAAILEKANAIRQAFAGSDDDDADSWSDS